MTALCKQTMPLAEAPRRGEWTNKTHFSIFPFFQSSTAFGYTPRYTFSTKEYLPDPKLYLYHYRIYDPIAGRWTQRDSIDYQDSINLYQFCGNNPVNAVDPSGLIAPLVAILIIVGFVATIDAGCRIAVNVRGGPYALTFPGLAPRTGKNFMKRTRVVQHVIREHERMHEGGASEREASIDSY